MSTRDVPERIGELPRIGRPGLTTLAQVAACRERDRLAMHGVGPKAVRILAAALAERGQLVRGLRA
ncbi:hypothetical protein [Asanoa sp. NPDC050611]|uniref:hypothetical protein n=1 Tax=Asanoa sp. NPDC050611 TaxID=3157098 RepID=UPI0033F4095D